MGSIKIDGPGGVEVMGFKPNAAGSLVGFVDVHVPAWKMRIFGCTAHQSHGKRWIGLPGKPSIVNGVPGRDEAGKVRYFPVLAFDEDEVRRRFSDAVVAALERAEPGAFGDA